MSKDKKQAKNKKQDRKKDQHVFQPTPLGAGTKHKVPFFGTQKALLCIDLQYLNCVEGYGVFESHRQAAISEAAIQYYLDRVERVVVPNVEKLQEYFRKRGYEVVHVRIQSLTRDGRDRSLEHKELGLLAPPGSKEAEFLPKVAPKKDEVVVNKTASGVFISTNLEYILRNLYVSELFVVGVYTNECVSSAVRSASDLGFHVHLISDATAATTYELHQATLLTTQGRYGQVASTEETVTYLEKLAQSEYTGALS